MPVGAKTSSVQVFTEVEHPRVNIYTHNSRFALIMCLLEMHCDLYLAASLLPCFVYYSHIVHDSHKAPLLCPSVLVSKYMYSSALSASAGQSKTLS